MSGKLVKLDGHGQFYWLTEDNLEGALAPLDHVKNGAVSDLDTALFMNGDSYAHVFSDGRILRYGKLIAHREDLVEVTP